MNNPYSPGETIYVFTESSFKTLGLNFDPLAPYAGCRICGAVYQSPYDRDTLRYKENDELWFADVWCGTPKALNIKNHADELRANWQRDHTAHEHSPGEVEDFSKTGFTLTPEAAHRLAPMGFAPSENRHEEIVDAMATAPRAPFDDCEG